MQAGLEVLREQGVDGLTVHEVSRRAGVSIGSIYARVPGREALILAIYERFMDWTAAQEADQLDLAHALEGSDPRDRIQTLVRAEVTAMLSHAGTMAVFMREARKLPEIFRRGAAKSQVTGAVFKEGILGLREHIDHPDPELAVDVAWRMIYCTTARRITHGEFFESSHPVSEQQLAAELARAVSDYLL
jgi:AcrR family transcriptional regulator